MITKLAKCAVALMTVATAKDAITGWEKFEEEPPIVKKGNGLDWFVFTWGLLMGLGVETGTNISGHHRKGLQCYGQTSDVIESLYFTYFYIYEYLHDRTSIEYITYVSVYIARGVNSISEGPCWSFGMFQDPSEGEIENEQLWKVSKIAQYFDTHRAEKTKRLQQATNDNNPPTQEELDEFDPYKLAYTQLKNSLATVNIFLLIMEVLEILTDMLTFSDMLKEDDYWNAGVVGGKGFVNGGFTIYYIFM